MRFTRPKEIPNGTPLAPLLDMVLLLLIFFVVTSSFATPTLELDLPSAESAGEAQRNALIVALDRDGAIELDGETATLDALATAFARAKSEGRPVELRADRSTDHEHVVAVLDRARSVGVGNLSIAVAAAPAKSGESEP